MVSKAGRIRGAVLIALILAVMVAFVGVKVGDAQAQSSAQAQYSSGTGESVVAEAQGWLGVPYVYGGASYSGVDCSGLTQQVFGSFGVALPHSAAGQYGYGVPGSGAAGDLVFADFTGGGIGHVGIATGDGMMINAPYPGTTVRYDPIPSGNLVGYRTVV